MKNYIHELNRAESDKNLKKKLLPFVPTLQTEYDKTKSCGKKVAEMHKLSVFCT